MSTTLNPANWLPLYGDSLWRFAMSRLHDQQAAEECIQEALVSALAAKDSFAGGSSELTWLTGILNHKILDHFRRQKRRGMVSLDAADAEGRSLADRIEDRSGGGGWGAAGSGGSRAGTFDRVGHRNAVPGPITDRQEVSDQLVADLSDCKDKLPPNLAEAFELKEVRGMDGPTICQVLNLTPTNLWTRLHRARAALRDCLEDKFARRSA